MQRPSFKEMGQFFRPTEKRPSSSSAKDIERKKARDKIEALREERELNREVWD
jgi:hypothetical protein